MTETIRTEYRALALDPKEPSLGDVVGGGSADDFEGPIRATAHEAHRALDESWDIGTRSVVLEKRTVRESDWQRTEG